jgi:lipopolysaccharide transport system ATP-binding protein
MGDVAIRAEGISKKYTIGAVRRSPGHPGSLSDTLSRGLRGLFGRNARPEADERVLWALSDISLEICKGESVGLIGRNGSGKSTLLKIFSRITEPTKGRAAMYGRICSLLEVGTGFHPELTGRDNVYLSGAILGMKKSEIDRKFDEIVAFSEVERFIDTPVKHYSSGMHVRLGFSVIAHMEPDILIVDEVMAVGDARFQQKCLAKMAEASQSGRTVVFVSHDMSAVSRLCKKAVLLDKGHMVKDGLVHEVVGDYLYQAGSMSSVREWIDPKEAPGNEVVRLRAIRVKVDGVLVKDSVDLGRPIGVEIEFDVLESGHVLSPCFVFFNDEGATLFEVYDRDPAWLRRPRPAGRYVSTAWIPGHYLGEGTIILTCAVNTEVPFYSHCCVHEAVAFHLHESCDELTARADYNGRMAGVVRPLLKWTTDLAQPSDR